MFCLLKRNFRKFRIQDWKQVKPWSFKFWFWIQTYFIQKSISNIFFWSTLYAFLLTSLKIKCTMKKKVELGYCFKIECSYWKIYNPTDIIWCTMGIWTWIFARCSLLSHKSIMKTLWTLNKIMQSLFSSIL